MRSTCCPNVIQHRWMQHVDLVFEYYMFDYITLDDVGLSLTLFKVFIQHRSTLSNIACPTMLTMFEQALKILIIHEVKTKEINI